MRIEFHQKVQDLTDEEREYMEALAIKPKSKRFKWRRVLVFVEDITGVYEVSDSETIIEFPDIKMTVKGSYDKITQQIKEADQTEDLTI